MSDYNSETYRFDLIHDAVHAEEDEPTDEQRELDIRTSNARLSAPGCNCTHCVLLRLLDVERAEVARLRAVAELPAVAYSDRHSTTCDLLVRHRACTCPIGDSPDPYLKSRDA